jgi:hypothetical protein
MKTLSIWDFRPIVGKIMMGLVLAAMIGSIDVGLALGKDDPKRKEKYDKGRYEQRGHDYRPYGYYGHRERVYYPPPPVIYAPPPAPGISIFFPPIFIRP